MAIASPETRDWSSESSRSVSSTGRRLSQPSQIEAASTAHPRKAAIALMPPRVTRPTAPWRESSCRRRAGW